MVIFSYIKRLFSRTLRLPTSVDALIVGLGNIGPAYVSTRHNIGFRVVEALCNRLSGPERGIFADADFSSGTLFSTNQVLAIKPRTLMNRSGVAIEKYLAKWQLPASRMLVVVDDYNLPLGKLRARGGGSDGGHNGLKSISNSCGEDFPRLRVGIGPLSTGKGLRTHIDFVLGNFAAIEEEQLKSVIPCAVEACELFVKSGIQAVMNKYNG
jgi:peptidyl-tRNA hydrolase, PTH1 family